MVVKGLEEVPTFHTLSTDLLVGDLGGLREGGFIHVGEVVGELSLSLGVFFPETFFPPGLQRTRKRRYNYDVRAGEFLGMASIII
jgi:hypothetical protein